MEDVTTKINKLISAAEQVIDCHVQKINPFSDAAILSLISTVNELKKVRDEA